jgi:uncharacterized protein YbcC (UPF0753/DUF2309 family)
MTHQLDSFNESAVLHHLKHYLPAQAPLKDFIHHNTLHAFQDRPFYEALRHASSVFGYKTLLSLDDYRHNYASGRISKTALTSAIEKRHGAAHVKDWLPKTLEKAYDQTWVTRIGGLRAAWKRKFDIDPDLTVQPILFRTVCSYLDQGISIWNFPTQVNSFLASVRELERNARTSFFKTRRAQEFLKNESIQITDLLKIVVGDSTLFEQYLFDQQFAHQGWSGMVSTLEDHPEWLTDRRPISLKDFILFELLLEIDAMDVKFGEIWAPLSLKLKQIPLPLFDSIPTSEYSDVLEIWHDAYEWSFYNQFLAAIRQPASHKNNDTATYQAILCIDDRELSLRDYLEHESNLFSTYAAPGFFGVDFYFQPAGSQFFMKQAPAPAQPKHLIREEGEIKRTKDIHFSRFSHSAVFGWLLSQTVGFISAIKLASSIIHPSQTAAAASSFTHMHPEGQLSIEHQGLIDETSGLRIGYTIEEMADRMEALLKGMGLVNHFARIVYIVGHGASSMNNPHYAAYNCGACSGRPGSVNARVAAHMLNHSKVRSLLNQRGIMISDETHFIGALHDTTRDEIIYFDTQAADTSLHASAKIIFQKALDYNARERSRRFELVDSKRSPKKVHKQILKRSVSLFETRPELNHATNALCIIGRRSLTNRLFLDRRAFANSYDYSIDKDGSILAALIKPIGPVCGGINLEYFFSRVDNHRLGAGTKLPHNVMGLIGVANGTDGDLRPGLPKQMIEFHDPVRLMVVVEQYPPLILKAIQSDPSTNEWYANEWIHLVAVEPETHQLYLYKDNSFTLMKIQQQPIVSDFEGIQSALVQSSDNLTISIIK